MTPGEVKRMKRTDCIIFLEGQYPIYDKKAVPFRTSRWKESERLAGKNGYRHPVKVVYNKKTMTYKTIESKSDIQFLNRSELEFYREAAKSNPHIKIIEMDEDEILYLNWNQPPQLTEAEIMELAQKVRQETEKEEACTELYRI